MWFKSGAKTCSCSLNILEIVDEFCSFFHIHFDIYTECTWWTSNNTRIIAVFPQPHFYLNRQRRLWFYVKWSPFFANIWNGHFRHLLHTFDYVSFKRSAYIRPWRSAAHRNSVMHCACISSGYIVGYVLTCNNQSTLNDIKKNNSKILNQIGRWTIAKVIRKEKNKTNRHLFYSILTVCCNIYYIDYK